MLASCEYWLMFTFFPAGRPMSFAQYTNLYKSLADLVEREISRDGISQKIVGKEIMYVSIC